MHNDFSLSFETICSRLFLLFIISPHGHISHTLTTFVSKSANLNCTSRYNISNDSDIQVLNILSNIENFMIFNIYNEKCQNENQEYTIERKLTSIDISEKAIICGDFNAHHS